MAKISKFDKTTVTQMHTELNKAFEAIADKYNVNINIGTIRYDENEMRGKLTINVIESDGAKKAAVKAFEHSNMLGEFSFGLGTTFKRAHSIYKVVDYRPKAHKNKIVIEDVASKKRYVCTPEFVNTYL